jgi:hypothetical protein
MQCDLDGLAANIKGALAGPRRAEWAFMVDEMVRNLRERQTKIERLSLGITAVANLIAESEGVAGLYLNGEDAPWADLLKGGQFEEWLDDFSQAVKLAEEKGGSAND